MQPSEWIENRTILYVRHGSHAYGTNIATSDEDFRGIAVAPPAYYHGFLYRFEQFQPADSDITIFDVQKFFQLASQCNPNVLEMLYVDPDDIITAKSAGLVLLHKRSAFLSKRARHTYSGYAMAQLKRIRGHYAWLKNPPKAPPTRASMGLPERTLIPADQLKAAEAAVAKKLEEWQLDFIGDLSEASKTHIRNSMAEIVAELGITSDARYLAAARCIGLSDNFIELLDRERRYKAAMTQWTQYQTWLRERNPARAELESKHGYDTKHAMHLVRLMRMCREILEGKELIVRRPDAAELLEIRNGAWTYEQLIEWAEKQDAEIAQIQSALPDKPDLVALNRLCVTLTESML